MNMSISPINWFFGLINGENYSLNIYLKKDLKSLYLGFFI